MSDEQWLKRLHDEHYSMLYRLAVRRMKSESDAEDILQDVFFLAYKKNIRNHPNPVGWLIKTTDYICKNYRRTNMRISEKQRLSVQNILDVSADRSLLSVASNDAEARASELLLSLEQTLSESEWELLKALVMERVTTESLSEQYGISVNAMRVRIHRLRNKVKIFLQKM